MLHPHPLCDRRRPITFLCIALLGLPFPLLFYPATAYSQTSSPADSPASIPAGAIPALPSATASPNLSDTKINTLSPKQVREADDAYLEGAKQIERKNLAAAERSFERPSQPKQSRLRAGPHCHP
jgi:general secretion pathway protein D